MGRIAITLFIIQLAVISDLSGQTKWSWPEKSENLKVFPSDWSGERLKPIMKGFSEALGVECSYCHVGEKGNSLSTYDFASDENPNKNRAREMIKMLGSINDHLKKIKRSGPKPVNMWCHTCHNGRPKPMTLAEELSMKYSEEGLESSLNHYNNLYTRFYGKGAYNFEDENTLNNFGYQLLEAGDVGGAIKAFELNCNKFPNSGNVWDSFAEAHMKAGNKDLAIEYYQKSLTLNPQNQNAIDILKKLKN